MWGEHAKSNNSKSSSLNHRNDSCILTVRIAMLYTDVSPHFYYDARFDGLEMHKVNLKLRLEHRSVLFVYAILCANRRQLCCILLTTRLTDLRGFQGCIILRMIITFSVTAVAGDIDDDDDDDDDDEEEEEEEEDDDDDCDDN
ncbi:hypothetical protein PoB_007692900 [Plakobranchus ocellatus]|uniref:Uncharacterized protein n=1 Tax=Plakobranchus ocellatus TaxID=259542 RepID=A0AAV4E1R2_9GAST|nr:hypothetical protein PoB_007692900 [Plakobranchus ocellatus]